MRGFRQGLGSVLSIVVLLPLACGGGSGGGHASDDAGSGGSAGSSASTGRGGSAGRGGSVGRGGSTGAAGDSGAANVVASTGAAKLGQDGGTLTTDDEAVVLEVPPDALESELTITVEPSDAPPDGALGTVFEIGPSGTVFATPITVTLSYAALDLGTADESALRVATYGEAGWEILSGAKLDARAKTVSGLTSHLSAYALIVLASGAVCAPISLSSACAGTSGSGVSGACPQPTCADAANVCDMSYPGSTLTDCKEDATTGTVGSCCFKPGDDVCFGQGEGLACAGASGSGAPSGGGSCPGTPTCADAGADVCSHYPGATFENCEDRSDGYFGRCCFAPEASVCMTFSTATACGGTSVDTVCPQGLHCADDPCAALGGTNLLDCTDTDTGSEGTCCYTVGTLPLPATSSGTTGSAGGTTPGGAGAGSSMGAGGSGGAGAPAGGTGGGAGSASTTACKLEDMPNGGDPTQPCGATLVCPQATYDVSCDPGVAGCDCFDPARKTKRVDASCDLDAKALLEACGFPTD